MKIALVISMYDEIDIVKETVLNLKNENTVIAVIQSDPGNEKMILDESLCDKYEKMPDLAGGRNNYSKVVEEKKEGIRDIIGATALTRNFSRGFTLIQDFDVDYVITITGDIKITNLKGITKIIEKMEKNNKIVAGTRTIGFTMFDEVAKFTQFQHRNITNIMPQFFIAKIDAVRNGLFCNIVRTNKYTTEQCLGDEIQRYCKENKIRFFDSFYRICDYGYPRFIDGLHYNPEQISKIPPPLEGIINWIRYWSNKKINDFITKIFLKIENRA
tara:strand:- start:86 stop:901 length:816 start_codon:yes stop_codon:yes gene_type:complete